MKISTISKLLFQKEQYIWRPWVHCGYCRYALLHTHKQHMRDEKIGENAAISMRKHLRLVR